MVMKIYARLALALLSCGTALLLATGGVAAHTGNHATAAAQAEALAVEPADAPDVADNGQAEVADQTTVAQSNDKDEDEDEDEDDEDEDDADEVVAAAQAAPAVSGGASAKVEASDAGEKAEAED
jgi:hypothetical protein